MANASLFGNAGSLVVMIWGLIALHRRPHAREWLAISAALTGGAVLLGRSLEIGTTTAVGDLFCVAAGLLYSGYIIILQKYRASLGGWSLLTWSSIAGLPVLLGIALWLGEPVWPTNWGPVVALALLSQLIGQGLLVFSLRHFSALVIGLALLTQPVVAVLVGWLRFDEVLGPLDFAGIALADLELAARTFATAGRGGATAGTGSNMAPRGNLTAFPRRNPARRSLRCSSSGKDRRQCHCANPCR